MAASYPTTAKSFATRMAGTKIKAEYLNDIQVEIMAMVDQLIASKLASLAEAPVGAQVLTSVAGAPTWVDKSGFSLSDHNHSGIYPQADGWIPATGAWTKGTGQTINVPAGADAIYNIGNQIKLTDTTVKYFYIIAVANTLLTVVGGTLVAAPTAGTCFYSKVSMPQGFPDVFTYTSTVTGFSSLTTNDTTFSLKGRVLTLYAAISGVSNLSTFTFTLPVTAVNVGTISVVQVLDNNVAFIAPTYLGANEMNMYKETSGIGFTTSGTKALSGAVFIYRI